MGAADMSSRDALERQRSTLAIVASNAVAGNNHFTDPGINLTNVDKIAIGMGTQCNIATTGGSGKIYFDDIRLYRPSDTAAE